MPAAVYSPDEGVVVTVSCIATFLTWVLWYLDLRPKPRFARGVSGRGALAVMPLVGVLLLLALLKQWAASDVRDSGAYLFQYVVLGAAWLGVALRFVPWLGISARDDGAERGNPAAAVALVGAGLGLVLCYAGGNVGDGPGWWVVVFSSGLATAGFFVVWELLEALAHPSEAVTIDRDAAAGFRLGAFLLAESVVLGRAVAGDWVSAGATLRDFAVQAWPALALLALALPLERLLRPGAERPRPSLAAAGVLPGALFLGLALAWVAFLGEPA